MYTLSRVFRALARNAATRRQVAIAGASPLTFGDLFERAGARAVQLEGLGVGRGDVVATLMGNRVAFFEVLVAASLRGATLLPLSPLYVAVEIARVLDRSRTKVCFTDSERWDLALRTVEAGARAAIQPLDAVRLPAAPPADPEDLSDPADVCWLALSGGTSGGPKLCRVTHQNLVGNLYLNALEWGWRSAGVHVALAPLAHGIGFCHALGQLLTGGAICLVDPYSPAASLEAMREQSTCWTALVPTMLRDLAGEALEREVVDSPRLIVCAGAPLRAQVRQTAGQAFPHARLIEYYGSTEMGWVTWIDDSEWRNRPGSVGRPSLGVEVQIVRDDGTPASPGEVGQVRKRGRPYAVGMLDDPEAEQRVWEGEWASSGDLGSLDSDGYLYLAGRRDDMIITGGLNVAPADVEDVLGRHPLVRECLVLGLPDARWGERVHAVVAHGANDESALQRELEALCARDLAAYKRPKTYTFVRVIPRTPFGKLSRQYLRSTLLAGEGTMP